MKALNVLIALKLCLLFTLAYTASFFIPYLGNFSFPNILTGSSLPFFIKNLAGFDGIHYVKIASEGYYNGGYAFFPFYPLLIRLLTPLFFGQSILAAIFIANTCLMVGCFYAVQLLKEVRIPRRWFFIMLFSFPTAFFFQAGYTESLFFMLAVLTLYFLVKRNYLLVALFALLAGATRIIGFFLLIPIIFFLWPEIRKSPAKLLYALAPLAGIGAYMLYQWGAAGDAFAFIHAQEQFGAGRSLHLVLLPQVYFRYLKIIISSPFNFGYFIALNELALFTLVFILACLDCWKRFRKNEMQLLSVGIFSIATLVFPTLTGTFLSTPRFALLSLSSFFYLAQLKNSYIKSALAILFTIFQIILFAFFSRGYFVS